MKRNLAGKIFRKKKTNPKLFRNFLEKKKNTSNSPRIKKQSPLEKNPTLRKKTFEKTFFFFKKKKTSFKKNTRKKLFQEKNLRDIS